MWAGERRGSIFGKLTNESSTSREIKMMFQTLIHENLQSEQVNCFCPQLPYGRNPIVSLQRLGSRTSFQVLNFSLQESLHWRIYLGYGSITTSLSCTVDSRITGHHGFIEVAQQLLGQPEPCARTELTDQLCKTWDGISYTLSRL